MANFSKSLLAILPLILKRYLPLLLLSFFIILLANEWTSNPPLLPTLAPNANISISNSNTASDEDNSTLPVDFSTDEDDYTKPIDISTNLDSEIQYDFPPFLRLYKSGRVQRLLGTIKVPCSTFSIPQVLCKDIIIDEKTGIGARLYMPNLTYIKSSTNKENLSILIFVHGGAFVIESASSPGYHRYLTKLVAKGRLVVVSVEYRLAPEYPLPTAYDDTWQAVKWVIENTKSGPEKFLQDYGNISKIFLGGDSAGGNIAHNTVLRAGKEGYHNGIKIKGLVLMNPYFWGKEPVRGEKRDEATRWRLESTWGFVCGEKYDINHPFVNPLSLKEKWRKLGCDRVLVTVSEWDLFRPRGVAYVEELRKSGWNGSVELYETKGEDHVYFVWKMDGEKAQTEMDMVLSFFNRP